MGTTSKGTVRISYRIKIDLNNLSEAIAKYFYGEIDGDIEVEDDELIIPMSHETKYEAWHCKATLESPEENEVEFDEPIDVDGANADIIYALNKLTSDYPIGEIDLDEDDYHFPEPYDPYDDNDAYDRWRDAQYDRDYAERNEE